MDGGSDLDLYDGSEVTRATPLSCFGEHDLEADETSLRRSLACRSHLLQAGADPTIGIVLDGWSAEEYESESMIRKTMNNGRKSGRLTVSAWTSHVTQSR